jgi:hypothetical protein
MAQLSRPFQIALGALVLFAAVWLLALHGHSSTSGSSSPAAPAPAPSAAAQAQKAAAPSPIYNGPAPGVNGLTRAIAKAHGAVAASQQNAKQLEAKSAQASGGTPPAATAPAPASAARSTAASKAPAKTAAPAAPTAGHHGSMPRTGTSLSAPAPQRKVEAELKQGKVVVLLFWNPKGADDVIARDALRALVSSRREGGNPDRFFGPGLNKHIAVHEGSQHTVASYGTITRGVQVYGTPTMLVINPHGRVITLTGSTDTYSIEQAIKEARAG